MDKSYRESESRNLLYAQGISCSKQPEVAVPAGWAQEIKAPGSHNRQDTGLHRLFSSQSGPLIKAIQNPFCTEAGIHDAIMPEHIRLRQQQLPEPLWTLHPPAEIAENIAFLYGLAKLMDWLGHQRRALLGRYPSLTELHLRLPSSVSLGPFGDYNNFSPSKCMCEPSSHTPDSGSPIATEAHVEQTSGSAFYKPAPMQLDVASGHERAGPAQNILRQASSIKAKVSDPHGDRSPGEGVWNSGSLRTTLSNSSNASTATSDGVMLLLQACEALDQCPELASALPSRLPRAPRPRSFLPSDPSRAKAALVRRISDADISDSVLGIKRERELIKAAGPGPAKKAAGGPRPVRTRRGRSELHGPCCHCMATDSPQWRKGPKCKPILCNACGTRFLRTRSLGKSAGRSAGRRASFSSASSTNLDEAEAAATATASEAQAGDDAGPPVSAAASSHAASPDAAHAHHHQDLTTPHLL